MEVNLKDLMDKSDITTDDLDYIVERLWDRGFCCYDLTTAFVRAYRKGRTAKDTKSGDKPYYTNDADVARHISKWCCSYINNLEDDGFP
jgi:hypothetical protein